MRMLGGRFVRRVAQQPSLDEASGSDLQHVRTRNQTPIVTPELTCVVTQWRGVWPRVLGSYNRSAMKRVGGSVAGGWARVIQVSSVSRRGGALGLF